MSPKLKAKEKLLQLLDKLPENIGFKGYHFLQQQLGKVELEQQLTNSQASYQTFLRLAETVGIETLKKTFLEIGSGWLPVMPYFFKYLSQAKAVHTFDLNRHYNPKKIKGLNKLFSEEYRLEISRDSENEYELPPDIHYFPRTDLSKVTLPRVEVVFSRFVLEHVEPGAMREMHRKFKEELPAGTFIVHLISPSDHRAYVDKNLSLQDFLRYSEAEWKKQQTKFDYHNRMRLPQYTELFEDLGYEIVHLEAEVPEKGSEAYEKFRKVPLHPDFQKYKEEELMAGGINMVLKV